ncbi:MAG: hypothetical protein CMJ81_23025 [Planctomycetaceae bacterium]|nr:hypothetical protein [Planctomycetaceae bacterium]
MTPFHESNQAEKPDRFRLNLSAPKPWTAELGQFMFCIEVNNRFLETLASDNACHAGSSI